MEAMNSPELSIIIPAFNESANIGLLIANLTDILAQIVAAYEIIVVDAGSQDDTVAIAIKNGAIAFVQTRPGYGGALKDAVERARGSVIITMDADLSHNPYLVKRLWAFRDAAHVVIASRYVRGGYANMPWLRQVLSVILNRFLCLGLSLPLHDVSSGFRLYKSEIFREFVFSDINFSVLVEIVVKAYMHGFQVKEIPFHYRPRKEGRSHAKIISFGLGFLRTFLRLWKARNTIASADYDDRAFSSRVWPQRFWQRRRYEIITEYVRFARCVLDAGCGSSKILGAFPQAVGLDISIKKLRFCLSLGNGLVQADIHNLPFAKAVCDSVVCSEVIEHIPFDENIFKELVRVLKPGGTLILGTPDYSRWQWRFIEWLYKRIIPGGYADEHITRFTRERLIQIMEQHHCRIENFRYIAQAELICLFRKD